MRLPGFAVLGVLCLGCPDKAAPPLTSLAPAPLPRLVSAGDGGADREAAYRLAPAPVFGEAIPKETQLIELDGTVAKFKGNRFDTRDPAALSALGAALGSGAWLIDPDRDTYLAQASDLLSVMDDKGLEVWLLHPGRQVAYKLTLRDEAAFARWLDEPKPGKIRIIQRSDGLEYQTNVGKLPGSDPNGPTVPVRSGQLDIAGARRALELLKGRFTDTPDLCLVPSFGTELGKTAAVLSADYSGPGKPIFDGLCLVYPRRSKPDAQ